MTERKTSLWTKILFVSIGILILMSVFSNALVIGERFREKSIYLEYAYYGLIVFLIIFGVVYPIFGVFAAPIFSLDKLHTADGTAKQVMIITADSQNSLKDLAGQFVEDKVKNPIKNAFSRFGASVLILGGCIKS